jgi:hypothetical protein
MQVTRAADRRALLDVSEPELVLLSNSLNEVSTAFISRISNSRHGWGRLGRLSAVFSARSARC